MLGNRLDDLTPLTAVRGELARSRFIRRTEPVISLVIDQIPPPNGLIALGVGCADPPGLIPQLEPARIVYPFDLVRQKIACR